MKIVLFLGVVILFFYLIFKAPDWSESDNSTKQAIGCTIMAVLIIGGILFTLLGSIKNCSNSNSPSYDYYDSPRK